MPSIMSNLSSLWIMSTGGCPLLMKKPFSPASAHRSAICTFYPFCLLCPMRSFRYLRVWKCHIRIFFHGRRNCWVIRLRVERRAVLYGVAYYGDLSLTLYSAYCTLWKWLKWFWNRFSRVVQPIQSNGVQFVRLAVWCGNPWPYLYSTTVWP